MLVRHDPSGESHESECRICRRPASIIETIDGGATWVDVTSNGFNQQQSIHPDFHDLQFTPDGGTLYVANDGGMYTTTDITERRSTGRSSTTPSRSRSFIQASLSTHPTPTWPWRARRTTALQRYDGNPSWDYVNCGDGGYSAIDRIVPSTGYTACVTGGHFRIQDSGRRQHLDTQPIRHQSEGSSPVCAPREHGSFQLPNVCISARTASGKRATAPEAGFRSHRI